MSRLSRAISTSLRSSLSPLRTSTLARSPSVLANFSTRLAGSPYSTSRESAEDTHFAAHLNTILPPLQFPPELARRILTHGSHRAAIHGHNGRLGFIGRRVLESYYLLFIHEVAQGRAHYDYDRLTSRALNTYFLGEHIAPRWSLGRVLLWVPTVSKEALRTAQTQYPDSEQDEALVASPGIAKSVGLYKVMGEAVQAVVGGVYHQFGGSVTHQLFHTRILPYLLLPGRSTGVPEEFHASALQICERMGGREGDLLCHMGRSEHAVNEHAHIPAKRKVAAAGM